MLMLAALMTMQGVTAATSSASVDVALRPPAVILDPGETYGDGARRWQGIPGIERTANGRLWATWYSGGPTEGMWNYVLLHTSGDDGETWSPVLVVDPPGDVRAFDPCLWLDPTGRLWLFWAQGYGSDAEPPKVESVWDGRAGVWAITTDTPSEVAPNWSAPRRLCNGIMMNKPTVTSSGAWLLPASVWRLPANPAHPHHLPEESAANVVGSRDLGGSWTRYGGALVANAAFDEHMIVEREDGALWMLLRTSRGIGESVSKDGGATWSAGDPAVFGTLPSARFFIRRLQSGNLLLVRHDPPDRKSRSHLKAFLSRDDGKTWSGGLTLDERNGVSYPDGVQAEDGRIYIIYDFDRYGAREIYMTVFTEDDVAVGAYASPEARQRILVNRATGPSE